MKKKVLWFTVFAVGFMGAGMAIAGTVWEQNIIVEAAVPEVQIIDRTPEKIAELKSSVIDRLLACESAGHGEDEAIILYDNNKAGSLKGKNVFSLGQLQFKVSTVQKYVKDRTGHGITQKEAVLLALDTEAARDLAEWIIFETQGGIFNWLNCSNKHGLEAEVTIIKKFDN